MRQDPSSFAAGMRSSRPWVLIIQFPKIGAAMGRAVEVNIMLPVGKKKRPAVGVLAMGGLGDFDRVAPRSSNPIQPVKMPGVKMIVSSWFQEPPMPRGA